MLSSYKSLIDIIYITVSLNIALKMVFNILGIDKKFIANNLLIEDEL